MTIGRIKSFANARKNLILLWNCNVQPVRPALKKFEIEGWRLKWDFGSYYYQQFVCWVFYFVFAAVVRRGGRWF
jgi:hypothetical protein